MHQGLILEITVERGMSVHTCTAWSLLALSGDIAKRRVLRFNTVQHDKLEAYPAYSQSSSLPVRRRQGHAEKLLAHRNAAG